MKDYQRVKVWQCNHCKEYFYKEKHVSVHQEECVLNPKNASCTRCDNLVMVYDVRDKLPVVAYTCKFKKEILSEQDVMLMDAECFVKRDDVKIPIEKTEAFIEYVKSKQQKEVVE